MLTSMTKTMIKNKKVLNNTIPIILREEAGILINQDTKVLKPVNNDNDNLLEKEKNSKLLNNENELTIDSRVIVVTSGKGGVGKTTTTANLGVCLAKKGCSVALIDADIGLKNLDLLLGLETRLSYTAMDIIDGSCRLEQAIIRDKQLKNLALLAISKNNQKYNVTQQHMCQLVAALQQLKFDFVLIDCPAGIDVGFIHAIAPANEAIIVTTPELPAIRDADRVVGLLEANDIFDIKLLVNRVRIDMIQNNTMLSVADVCEMLSLSLLGAIPEDQNVIISTNKGKPLALEGNNTISGFAYDNIANRLLGKEDSYILNESPSNFVINHIKKITDFFFD
uniref:septum site-determining protein MinD n=1 Tax=Prototheca fontanea TaxID=2836215 RepID=UPI00300318E9